MAKSGAMLSSFQLRSYRSLELSAQRQTHDMLRHTVERLWYPFTQNRRGADLDTYRFRENLASIRCPGNTFTCQVNGLLGGTRVLEDFFSTVLSGFDILHASVDASREKSLSTPTDLCNYSGYYVLAHTRPFLGWKPTPTSLCSTEHPGTLPAERTHHRTETVLDKRMPAALSQSLFSVSELKVSGEQGMAVAPRGEPSVAIAQPDASPNTYTLVVPFTTHVEGMVGHGRLSHLVLRTPVMEMLCSRPQCPEMVQKCLASSTALRMFAMLLRAGVKPELITANTLLSASKQNEAWSSALGIL